MVKSYSLSSDNKVITERKWITYIVRHAEAWIGWISKISLANLIDWVENSAILADTWNSLSSVAPEEAVPIVWISNESLRMHTVRSCHQLFLPYIVRHSCARVVVSRWSQWDVAYKIDWMEFQSRVALTWERLPAIAPNKSISVVRIGQEGVVRSTSANIRPTRSVAHGYTMTIERIELRSWIAFSVELSSSPAPNVTGAGPWVRNECLWGVTK